LPVLLDFEIAPQVVEAGVDVHALQLAQLVGGVTAPLQILGDMDLEFVDFGCLTKFALSE
jgi:hypothetical protein